MATAACRPRVAAGLLAPALLIAALTVASCASSTGADTNSSPPASVPVGTVSTTPPAAAPPSVSPSAQPTLLPTAQLTLTGTVERGAEPSCLLLPVDGARYLLMGGDPAVVVEGARVTVTGHVVTGIATHCMAGIPFQVVQAKPAG